MILKAQGKINLLDHKELLERYDFKNIGSYRAKNYTITIKDKYNLQLEFYDLDLHLEDDIYTDGDKYTLRQGYRCPNCNALYMKPLLSCTKDIIIL